MVAAHREHARLRLHTEREPARDPSRGRKGAVCAEAGRTRPRTSPPESQLENGIILLFVGGYCQATKETRISRCCLETWVTHPSHTNLSHFLSQNSPFFCVACTVFVGRHTRERATQ